MNTPIWQRLPEGPPTEPRSTTEDQTVVLDRDALAGPPPAPSPRRDSPWWRAGVAAVLVAVLGGIAWLVSSNPLDDDAVAAGELPEALAPAQSGEASGGSGPGLDSFFEDGSLPPEIEELLRDGFDRFQVEPVPPGFEEFFGPDGRLPNDPFAPGGPFSEGSPFFERFFAGDVPPALQDLLDRLPDALSGVDDPAAVRELIAELLSDPDLPDPLRRMLERIEARLPADG